MEPRTNDAHVELTRVELLDVMEHVRHTLASAGTWRFKVILLPFLLDGRVLAGSDGGRAWMAPRGEPTQLKGVDFRDVVERFHDGRAVLDRHGQAYVFDVLSSGPVEARVKAIRSRAFVQRVEDTVDAALRDVSLRRAHRDARRARGTGTPFQLCELCHPLDAHGMAQPARSHLYRVLGAPLFHDRGSRGWCIKQCPCCGTRFGWVAGYTYLVNGASEDEESLWMLGADDEKTWLAAVEACLRAGEVGVSAPGSPRN